MLVTNFSAEIFCFSSACSAGFADSAGSAADSGSYSGSAGSAADSLCDSDYS